MLQLSEIIHELCTVLKHNYGGLPVFETQRETKIGLKNWKMREIGGSLQWSTRMRETTFDLSTGKFQKYRARKSKA